MDPCSYPNKIVLHEEGKKNLKTKKKHVTHNPYTMLRNRAKEKKRSKKKDFFHTIHSAYTQLDVTEMPAKNSRGLYFSDFSLVCLPSAVIGWSGI